MGMLRLLPLLAIALLASAETDDAKKAPAAKQAPKPAAPAGNATGDRAPPVQSVANLLESRRRTVR